MQKELNKVKLIPPQSMTEEKFITSGILDLSDTIKMGHIPMLFVSGSHYEIGYQMGKHFQKQVQYYYKTNGEWLKKFQDFVDTSEGEVFCNSLWENCEIRFPQYVEELKGMSDGSEVPFDLFKLQNLERELATKLGLFSEIFGAPTGCTDVLINSTEEKLIGHNEDWITAMKDRDVLLCADIQPYTSPDGTVIPAERFVVHTWPGVLMGMNSGFNKHGLAFSIDHLFPVNVDCTRTAELFLCRKLLSASSIEEGLEILKDDHYGVSLGFCVNIGAVDSKNMLNIEVLNEGYERQSKLSVTAVKESKPLDLQYGCGVFAHYNNIETPIVTSLCLKHCIGRKARIEKALPAPRDVQSLLSVIGDAESLNPEDNVYMDHEAGYPWATVASVVFDLRRQTMDVFKRSPKEAMPVARIPFSVIKH